MNQESSSRSASSLPLGSFTAETKTTNPTPLSHFLSSSKNMENQTTTFLPTLNPNPNPNPSDPLLPPSTHLEPPHSPPYLGMEFPSDTSAKLFYSTYASHAGFSIRMNKSRRSRRDNSVIMRRFVCTREGFHSKRILPSSKPKRNRSTSRLGCMAMIEIVKNPNSPNWIVTKLVTDHSHPTLLNTVPADRVHISPKVTINPFSDPGEPEFLLRHLACKQAECSGFFYAVQVDNCNRLTNVFWADARERNAYKSFGDAVVFDTSYRKTKYMMPFAAFRGVNHHCQAVTFGCALLMDETKGSYVWLFETWMAAIGGRRPKVLVTDMDKAMEGAIGRVFTDVSHRFCRWHVLSRCKQKLSDVYLKNASFGRELKECVERTETAEEFESCWQSILARYELWDNAWLKMLHDVRDQWVPVYLRDRFFPDLSGNQKSESLNKFFKRNFNTKTSLLTFVTQFEQAMLSQHEKEAQADYSAVYSKPLLKSPSPIEKQAADVYTCAVFERFQEEFVESLGYYAEKLEDGVVSKYSVVGEEGPSKIYFVNFNETEKRINCSCFKFECCGILCRHALRVFFVVGIRVLPDEYILRRWTKSAMSDFSLSERTIEPGLRFDELLVAWYNDLCVDAVKYGIEGATSVEVYKVAKAALQKAFAEVMSVKNMHKKGQQNMQRFARLQKMQYKMPLPKLTQKKSMARGNQREETSQNRKNPKDDPGEGSESILNEDAI